MIRVIIVDDETRICKLIMNLIQWDELGMEIVGIAHNGVDALELVRTKEPHLVITDIRMPGYDGLEMIELAKTIKKELEFILISGYEEFAHAQKAMSYGVKDYLCKPINKENLLTALGRVHESIQTRNRQECLEREYESIQKDVFKIRESFLRDLVLLGADQSVLYEREAINQNYYFQFREGVFRIVAIQFDSMDPAYSRQDGLAGQLAAKFELSLQNGSYDGEMIELNGNYYVLINYAQDQKEIIHSLFQKGLMEFKMSLSPLGYFVTIGYGEEITDLKELKFSLETARAAIDDRILKGTGQIIEATRSMYHPNTNEERYLHLQKKLIKAVDLLDAEKINKAIINLKEELFLDLKNNHWLSGSALKRLVWDIVDSYYITMRRNNVRIVNALEERAMWEADIDHAYSLDLLFRALIKGITLSLTKLSDGETKRNSDQIRLAKLYIEEHYMENLSLEDLGAYLGFNPSYFSTLFKKETGISFVEYVGNVRMEKAKELLMEPDLKIQDICFMVGYNDVRYFRKLFSQATGLSPKEFRRLFT